MEKNLRKNTYVCVCVCKTESLCYTPEMNTHYKSTILHF